MTRSARAQHRLFRLILRVYPPWFRQAHAEEMEDLFLTRLDRARSARALATLWMRVLRDTASTMVAFRRLAACRQHPHASGKGHTMFWQDLRHGLRLLARSPLFTAGVVTLLAIGIGANVAVFTLVDRLLIRPMPYDRPDEVVRIRQDSDAGVPSSNAFPAYRDMAALGFFQSVMATSSAMATWDNNAQDTDVTVEFTTSSHLDVAGLEVLRGRWFASEHDVIGGEQVAVVSAAAWRSRFQADPGVIGRTIRLNGLPVTIIGIGPERLPGSYPPVVTLLVRGIGRSGEIAIRRAMGAGSLQVARLYLMESVLLSVAGGAAGIVLAHLGLAAIGLAPLPSPFSATLDLAIDGRILFFAVGLTMATGVLFGLAPALRTFRTNVADDLRDDSRTASLGRGMLRLRNGLVVLQVAGSFLLILVTGLQTRSLMTMQRTDPGVEAD